ncbi:MAG: hypothetical protein IK099_16405 [Clostridia bacterium]|nr:hypothetical protein [Clostridia bacterium]
MVDTENAKKGSFAQAVKAGALSFLETVKSGPDIFFILLVVLYVAAEYSKRINWTDGTYTLYTSNFLNIAVVFGSGAYLCYKLAVWKKLWKEPALLVLAVLVLMGASGGLFFYLNEDWRARRVIYAVVFEIFLCLMAYGKNFKRLMQWVLLVPILTLVIAGLGRALGFTQDMTKTELGRTTSSLGIIYPNTWGYIAFQAMLIGWYLYLRKKNALSYALTFVLFWGMAAFMYFIIGCKTIAVLSLAFPLFSGIIVWLESRERKPGKKPGIVAWLFFALPALCYLLTVVLGFQMEWVGETFYDTPLHTMAMRFVQGGIALEYFGFPLFGHSMRITEYVGHVINGTAETLYVMDNAYSSFTITKGVLWMAGCLALLTAAQWKGWKHKDYGIMAIGGFMLVFALMERPGLELWYNFVLLYPLASLAEPVSHKGELKKYFFGDKKQHRKRRGKK